VAIGGVPNLLVPDNTKVAVIKACLYQPQVNRTYAEMATHYGVISLYHRPILRRGLRRRLKELRRSSQRPCCVNTRATSVKTSENRAKPSTKTS
jgi:transposase